MHLAVHPVQSLGIPRGGTNRPIRLYAPRNSAPRTALHIAPVPRDAVQRRSLPAPSLANVLARHVIRAPSLMISSRIDPPYQPLHLRAVRPIGQGALRKFKVGMKQILGRAHWLPLSGALRIAACYYRIMLIILKGQSDMTSRRILKTIRPDTSDFSC